MQIQEVIQFFEEIAPLHYAEEFDNVGLIVGNKHTQVTNILVTLDTLENVVDEAISKDCNLIVSFHPIVFSGLKKLNGNSYVERVVIKALQNNIAIFAIHTALDNAWNGVNAIISRKLELINTKILIPKRGTIKKLTTFVPKDEAEALRKSLFKAGAGSIGNYENCSYNTEGIGTFKGNEDSNPSRGERGNIHYEPETQISVTFHAHLEQKVLEALFKNHSYEEVAYEVITLENTNEKIGMGMIGELDKSQNPIEFLQWVKKIFQTGCVKHSTLSSNKIKKVAVLGGSGSFAIEAAIRAKADIYISADFKYHDFFKAENKLILADIGHYESEQFTKNELVDYLTKKISNFAPALERPRVILSQENTNPIKYL